LLKTADVEPHTTSLVPSGWGEIVHDAPGAPGAPSDTVTEVPSPHAIVFVPSPLSETVHEVPLLP
jgi:hypothetical protein